MNNVLYLITYIKKIQMNQFIIGGASIGKTLTLMFLIQALIHFYNRHLHSNLFKKKKALFMALL
jgi:hypothetical protein